LREIEQRQSADQHYLEEGVTILEMARNAQRLFDSEEPMQKRRLLNFVVSNSTWANGEKLWGARRRSWHLHRPYEPMEVAPWPKSMISAEA
jgi:hypothetical protein